MKTWHSIPALAAYAAAAPPAFPAVGRAILVRPSSFAFDTAAERPRALKDPVGLPASSLIQRLEKPAARPSRSARSSGAPPSPSETMLPGSSMGIISCHLQI